MLMSGSEKEIRSPDKIKEEPNIIIFEKAPFSKAFHLANQIKLKFF